MSEATKRKHVTHEAVHGDVKICKNQFIVKVIESKGNNLHLVENERGESTLCSMPPKFRKNVWIKKGDFLIAEQIPEGKKVTCEMVHILYPPQIKDLKADNEWPTYFQVPDRDTLPESGDYSNYRTPPTLHSDSDSDGSLEANVNQLNRPVVYLSETDEDSEETDSEEEIGQEE